MPIIFADMSLPQPSGDFEWVQESWGLVLRCSALAAVAPHCFSTRDLDLDNGSTGWHDLARGMGVNASSLVRMRQVHCTGVFDAGSRTASMPEADIAVTDDPSVAVSVKVADCVPILVADPRTGAVAAIHAGWRGTAMGAAIVAVRSLQSRYGTNPADVIAAVGPSIGPCCYEVGADLMGHFSSHARASAWFTRAANPRLDLWCATRDQLATAGVPVPQIHVAALCTFDHPAVFHSYRRDGKDAGRLVAAIRIGRDTTP